MTGQLTLGVIGHVDHGKTALVRALTGIETDRLKEEQERGLSIVLGFSYLELAGGSLDLIDVPGHEDFIRTMISGATGIDGVLMIVAANEGIMPQTKEHFDIAGLLGVQRGVIVVTKADLATDGELELVEEMIREYVEGSFLEDAEIVATSALKGEGLENLRTTLAGLSEGAPPKTDGGQFFMPVDRAFAMSGFGAVVTGTLRGGRVRPNDNVEILPWGGTAGVRGLQVHGETTTEAQPGQRVAINLRGLKKGEIKRGDTIAAPGTLKTSRRIDTEVTLLGDQKQALKNGVAVRVLFGTTEVIAKTRLLDQKQIEPGATGLIQLRCQSDITTHRSERFILRSVSPVLTIGGGRILDVDPPRHRRFDDAVTGRLQSAAGDDADAMVASTLAAVGVEGVDIATLQEKLGLDETAMTEALAELGAVILGEQRAVARASHAALLDEISAAVEAFHGENPRQQGVASGTLKKQLKSPAHADVFQHAIDEAVDSGEIQDDNGILRSAGFDPYASLSDSERGLAEDIERIFRAGGLAPPLVDVVLRTSPGHRSLYKLLMEMGQIVQLRTYDRNSKMALHRDTLQDVELRLQEHFPYPKDFAVSDVRDLLGATRKYVVPLMEHLDATGITIRNGNLRRLRGQ
ncbi:MAG: selenocysteine-specific translation elongation factor [Candidatus Rariloculaceae bacterium]